MQQENMQAQADANIKQQEASAAFEQQKQQSSAEAAIQIETARQELNDKSMMAEAEVKKQLMMLEYEMNLKLKEMELKNQQELASKKEAGANQRTAMQSKQKPFESKGNDVLNKSIDMSRFGPR